MNDFTFPQIINHFHLESDFQYVFKYNRSNYLPYHNLNHAMSMVVRAGKACKWFYGQSLPPEDNRIYYRYWRDIFVAILFHDLNHSGGLNTDEENIRMATLNQELINDEILPYNLIYYTKYPYDDIEKNVFNNDEKDQIKIIRDCDLTQWAEEDWFYQTFLGLFQEFRFKNSQILDAIDKQIEFMTNLVFFTDWAKTTYDELRLQRIEELKEYRGLFE